MYQAINHGFYIELTFFLWFSIVICDFIGTNRKDKREADFKEMKLLYE